jgi:hydroxyacylglutathione hydrolase
MKIEVIPCLKDNYAYLLWDESFVAVVDPSEAAPVQSRLQKLNLKLTHILNTHHHWDHVGGNQALKTAYGCKVFGGDARIPGIDAEVGEAATFELGKSSVRVLNIPGHTRGHVAFYIESVGWVFTGDTLFSLGCGKLFEGTPAQMVTSLRKLSALPEETQIYCGHEYTLVNATFAVTVDSKNEALREKKIQSESLRKFGKATVPSSIGEEIRTNPFLRTSVPAVRKFLQLENNSEVEVFAALRALKDNF